MTESAIFEVLSSVSDQLINEPDSHFPVFDTEISAWKKNTSRCPNMIFQLCEPVKIRIRTANSWMALTPNSLSKLYIGTQNSSSCSWNDSPSSNSDRRRTPKSEECQNSSVSSKIRSKKKKNLSKVLQSNEE